MVKAINAKECDSQGKLGEKLYMFVVVSHETSLILLALIFLKSQLHYSVFMTCFIRRNSDEQ